MSGMARNFTGATRPLQEAREKETVIGARSAEHLFRDERLASIRIIAARAGEAVR